MSKDPQVCAGMKTGPEVRAVTANFDRNLVHPRDDGRRSWMRCRGRVWELMCREGGGIVECGAVVGLGSRRVGRMMRSLCATVFGLGCVVSRG
jgi:hypothetical protein